MGHPDHSFTYLKNCMGRLPGRQQQQKNRGDMAEARQKGSRPNKQEAAPTSSTNAAPAGSGRGGGKGNGDGRGRSPLSSPIAPDQG